MNAVNVKSNSVCKKSGFVYNVKRHAYDYALILPAMIFVFVFAYLPLLGSVMAFQDFDIMDGILGSKWVGLDNFKTIFSQPNMLKAVKNTLIYGVVILFGAFPFPILLAILFNELRNVKFKKIVQTVSYMPYFLSWISVIGLFYSFLATEGPINQILGQIIGESFVPKNILMESEYFLPIIFISHLWKNVGWASVVFLAAITGIDPTLYEAATVDGCGKLRQVWHITLPCLKTTAIVMLVMSLGSLFNTNFEQLYGFQNVYIQEETDAINTMIYRQGIQNGKYSLATAFGFAQGLVTLVLVITSNAISKKLFSTSIW